MIKLLNYNVEETQVKVVSDTSCDKIKRWVKRQPEVDYGIIQAELVDVYNDFLNLVAEVENETENQADMFYGMVSSTNDADEYCFGAKIGDKYYGFKDVFALSIWETEHELVNYLLKRGVYELQ